MPELLRWTALGIMIVIAVWCAWGMSRRHGGTTTEARERRTEARHRTERSELAADKPPYQPPTPGLPPTSGMRALDKLPGQDRLTRDDRTGMDVAATDPTDPTDPTVSAAPDDHPSGGHPLTPATTAMPAIGRPAVPGAAPAPGPAGSAPRDPDPPMPVPDWMRPPAETRAARRVRLERLIEADRQSRQNPLSGPVTPSQGPDHPSTPT